MWRKQKQDGLALWNARHRRAVRRRADDSMGLASIVVVFILIVVLSLISIGFTKIIQRGTQSSVNSQQAAAATAAAQSVFKPVANFIQNNAATPLDSSNCTNNFSTLSLSQSLGGSTKFSCLLVDKTPPNLQYQKLTAYKSLVVKLQDSTDAPITKLMFSWQATGSKKNLVAPASPIKLYDETYWTNSSNNYESMLRVSIYPIFSGDTNFNTTKAAGNTKTFFLYPQTGASGTVHQIHYSDPSGLVGINCGAKDTPAGGPFNGSTDNYNCSAIFDSLPGASSFYAQITPIYNQTNVQIRANTSSGEIVKFKDAQALVDVTANSGGASKRLQARVDISNGTTILPDDNAMADNALRSAAALCKRLVVTPPSSVTVDSGTPADCGLAITPPQPPILSFRADATEVPYGGSTTLRWSESGGDYTFDSCTGTGGLWGAGTGVASPASSSQSQNTGTLTAVSTTYTLTCHNNAQNYDSPVSRVTITLNTPPPAATVNLMSDTNKVRSSGSAHLTWTSINTPASGTPCTSSSLPSNSSWITPSARASNNTTSPVKTSNIFAYTSFYLDCPSAFIGGAAGHGSTSVRVIYYCTYNTDNTEGGTNNPDIYNIQNPPPYPDFTPCVKTKYADPRTWNATFYGKLRPHGLSGKYWFKYWSGNESSAKTTSKNNYGPGAPSGSSDIILNVSIKQGPDGCIESGGTITGNTCSISSSLTAATKYNFRLCANNANGNYCDIKQTFYTRCVGGTIVDSNGNCTAIVGCNNGAINPPACDQCADGFQYSGGQCVPISGGGGGGGNYPNITLLFNTDPSGYAENQFPRCISNGNWWDNTWNCAGQSDAHVFSPQRCAVYNATGGTHLQGHPHTICSAQWGAYADNYTDSISCQLSSNGSTIVSNRPASDKYDYFGWSGPAYEIGVDCSYTDPGGTTHRASNHKTLSGP